MIKTKNNKKEIKKCHFCDKNLVKKYISQHIRQIHKENEYCNIIKRGMTYKNLSLFYIQFGGVYLILP